MSLIRLYLDEDVNPLLAEHLRARGFDAASAVAAGRRRLPDHEQLLVAVQDGRALLTHNRNHFLALARAWSQRGMVHRGILVAGQWPFPVLLRRTLRTLSQYSAEDIENLVVWIC